MIPKTMDSQHVPQESEDAAQPTISGLKLLVESLANTVQHMQRQQLQQQQFQEQLVSHLHILPFSQGGGPTRSCGQARIGRVRRELETEGVSCWRTLIRMKLQRMQLWRP